MEPDAPVQTEQPAGAANGNGTGEGGGDSLYDLSAAPEHLRPLLEAELKKVEARVTPRFQEAADYRKQWEPYEGVEGLTDIPPEVLENLLSFGRLAAVDDQGKLADREGFESWWKQVGDSFGLFDEGNALAEPDAGGKSEQMLEQVKDMFEERFAPLEQKLTEQENQARQQAVHDQIDGEFAKLESEHGALDDDTRRRVLALAYAHIDPETGAGEDIIAKGFADFQAIAGKGADDLLGPKLDQGAPVANGGAPSTEAEEFQGFGDPNLRAAMEARVKAA